MTLPLDIETPPAAHAPGAAGGDTSAAPAADGSARPGVRGEADARPVPTVVGLDLSLTRTGVATLNRSVSITSSGNEDATLSQRQQRLRQLRQQIIAACENRGEPDLVVIEGPSYGSKNAASRHDRSGLWWLLIDVFTIRGWRVIEVSPSTRMKYATGKGQVDKDVVLTAAIKRLPMDVTNTDEADAAWLCAIGHALLGAPIVTLPATHLAALDKYRSTFTSATTTGR